MKFPNRSTISISYPKKKTCLQLQLLEMLVRWKQKADGEYKDCRAGATKFSSSDLPRPCQRMEKAASAKRGIERTKSPKPTESAAAGGHMGRNPKRQLALRSPGLHYVEEGPPRRGWSGWRLQTRLFPAPRGVIFSWTSKYRSHRK